MLPHIQIDLEDVARNLEEIIYQVNRREVSYMVYKNGKPYVVILPPRYVELFKHASSI